MTIANLDHKEKQLNRNSVEKGFFFFSRIYRVNQGFPGSNKKLLLK